MVSTSFGLNKRTVGAEIRDGALMSLHPLDNMTALTPSLLYLARPCNPLNKHCNVRLVALRQLINAFTDYTHLILG